MYKRGASGEGFRPTFSILNPELTQTLPAYQTACGITDIMAHLFEIFYNLKRGRSNRSYDRRAAFDHGS